MRRRVFRPWRSLEELHEVELLLYNDKGISESFPDDSSTRRDSGIAHVGEQSLTSISLRCLKKSTQTIFFTH